MSILKQCQSNDLYQYTLSSGNGTFRYFASSPPGRFEPLDVSLPGRFATSPDVSPPDDKDCRPVLM